ncbi:MAG: DUF2828 family protein [Clostridia bacterium]|nr:DUF2828 family protein [Clostridia bacterium]
MYNELLTELNKTYTENGAVTNATTGSYVLDLFSSAGAMRSLDENKIAYTFNRAMLENAELALKTMFYARDVRGGLGERRAFRVMLKTLALTRPDIAVKNLENIATYGRYDDLMTLLYTPCESEMIKLVKDQLCVDIQSEIPSLLAKWLPSVNTSSYKTNLCGKRMARLLGMTEKEYRKTLTELRAKIRIIENNLREKDYTFEYEKQTAGSLFKYRKAFMRNDNARYDSFLDKVESGEASAKADNLYPYQVVSKCLNSATLSSSERKALNATWEDMKRGYDVPKNAIAVIDTSGSMEWGTCNVAPIDVAISLGMLFAERNEGEFAGSFITFSSRPQLVKITGKDVTEKAVNIKQNSIVANTDIDKVFSLILKVAVKHNLPQSEIPQTVYLISDMEFDSCAENAELSNFENAKQKFEKAGYVLPQIVFWNVCSRHLHQPVTQNEQGAILVSGASPNVFKMVVEGKLDPYEYMLSVLSSKRYEKICA